MSFDQDTYEALVERVESGDEGAISQLLGLCEPAIRRHARSLLGPLLRPELDSVDIVQSVQIALLLGVRKGSIDVSDPDRLVGLAATIVRRKVADHWRKRRKRREILERIDDGDLLSLSSAALSDNTYPNSMVEWEDQMRLVLAELSHTERRLLELRMMGHSTAEAAELMGEDAAVLRVYLSRMRRRFRQRNLFADWF